MQLKALVSMRAAKRQPSLERAKARVSGLKKRSISAPHMRRVFLVEIVSIKCDPGFE